MEVVMPRNSLAIEILATLRKLTGEHIREPMLSSRLQAPQSPDPWFVVVPRLTDRSSEASEVLEWTPRTDNSLITAGWWLDDFIRLAADTNEIRRWAERHGPLGSVVQAGIDALQPTVSEFLDLSRAHALIADPASDFPRLAWRCDPKPRVMEQGDGGCS
jgi:hypothetical protein